MLPGLTYAQLNEWSRYYAEEPFGGQRDDLRFEVFRLRLLIGLLGDGKQELPAYMYPHEMPQEEDPVAVVKRLKERWAEIEQQRKHNGNSSNRS